MTKLSTQPVDLPSLRISKRLVGFSLAATILVALFLIPLLTRVSPAFEEWQAGLPIPLTRLLNPGALSAGHALFADKCSTCHKKAFHAVTEEACTSCHAAMGTHLPGNHAEQGRLDAVRCTACHPAHAGKAIARKDISPTCINCHAGIDAPVAQARDFGSTHPEFQLAFPQGKETVRVAQDKQPLPPDESGLKFSHEFHLDKKGISTPDGDTVLTCQNCHKIDAAGNDFAPIEMKATCQQSRCHTQLLAEPVSVFIPHGSERLPMEKTRTHYLNSLAESPEELVRQCGPIPKDSTGIGHAIACANLSALKFAGLNIFQSKGEMLQCGLCHTLRKTENRETPWRVTAIHINRDWHTQTVFSHAKHATSKCEDCHQKSKSARAEDLSMPDIASCRQCHTGMAGSSSKVKSRCNTCHSFHRHPTTPTG